MSEPQLKYITTCRMCRKEILKAAPFIPVVNGTPDPRMMKFGMALFQHMATEHQDAFGAILMIACYQITDPYLIEQLEPLRWAIHGHTSKNTSTDETLEMSAALAAEKFGQPGDGEAQKYFAEILKDFRDYLTETGKHGPKIEQAPLVIV